MNELMNAECVIQKLAEQHLITMREWQNRHPADQDYSVYFSNPNDLTSDIGIYIIKRSGQYYILRSLINVLSYRHNFNADHIYRDCAIGAA